MKRARNNAGGSFTGGTGDIKPQILTLTTGVAGASDDYVTAQLALPVPRFGAMKTKATIFELLSCDWYLNIENSSDPTNHTDFAFLSTVVTRASGDTSTLDSFSNDALDPRNFACVMMNRQFVTSGPFMTDMPIHIDFTDNNGNGILIATDKLVISGGSVTVATVGSYVCKVLYRLVNVGITEYVGIVQSQQQ